ncbi:9007_t:CDS:2, partial [Acaulospora colombiana]
SARAWASTDAAGQGEREEGRVAHLVTVWGPPNGSKWEKRMSTRGLGAGLKRESEVSRPSGASSERYKKLEGLEKTLEEVEYVVFWETIRPIRDDMVESRAHYPQKFVQASTTSPLGPFHDQESSTATPCAAPPPLEREERD